LRSESGDPESVSIHRFRDEMPVPSARLGAGEPLHVTNLASEYYGVHGHHALLMKTSVYSRLALADIKILFPVVC
jgi:hypothetical protein